MPRREPQYDLPVDPPALVLGRRPAGTVGDEIALTAHVAQQNLVPRKPVVPPNIIDVRISMLIRILHTE
jgi:hypothetical protein